MILWQKQVTPQWLAVNQPSLEEIAANDVAVISRPGKVRSLVQVICRRRAGAQKLVREFGGVARVLPRNWLKFAQKQEAHPPIRIGRRLEIISEPAAASKINTMPLLVIPAAGAFGTGEHATTAMSLRLLEEMTRNRRLSWRLLDAGTGTGVLALAARRLGASEVLGIDNDPRAIAHAQQNARLNRISRTRFIAADLLRWKPSSRYEVVTANLFSELLIAALPTFRRALRARGRLIVSGVLRDQAEPVIRALCCAGFQLKAKRRRGKWVALLARVARKTGGKRAVASPIASEAPLVIDASPRRHRRRGALQARLSASLASHSH
jgi:ribosomal protein L11 methyltransferase